MPKSGLGVLQAVPSNWRSVPTVHRMTWNGGEHQIELSYSWVKGVLQGAGLIARGRKRGQYRKRRPLPGMLLHIDGSQHGWFQDERWYDLLVILDDATSEIYYATAWLGAY
jgi:hypothetical protein